MMVLLCVVAACAEPPSAVVAPDADMTLLPGGPITSNSGDSCLEPQCVAVQEAYISHYTELNCQGTEYYYTGYFHSDGKKRSWNGQGVAGTILRTASARSWKGSNGACNNPPEWGPTGNQLSAFVRIYRGTPPVCDPSWFVLSGPHTPDTPGNYSYAAAHDFPSSATCGLPTSKSITWTRDGQVQSQCTDNTWCTIYVTAGPSFTMGVTMVASNSVNSKTISRTMSVTNAVKCAVGLSISGETRPGGAGYYTYTANASAGECGGPFSYTWRQYYRMTTGYSEPCGNQSSCTIYFTPNNPFTLVATASRTWNDGSTWTQTSELPVSAPFAVYISGPTALSNTEWGNWSASVSGGHAPFGVQWYVDGSYDSGWFSMGRSFWGESWHTIRVVASDGVGQTAEHEISVYVGPPGSGCTQIVGCEAERRIPATPATRGPRARPTPTVPWIPPSPNPFARP